MTAACSVRYEITKFVIASADVTALLFISTLPNTGKGSNENSWTVSVTYKNPSECCPPADPCF